MAAAMALASPRDAPLTWIETGVGPLGEIGTGNGETRTVVADPAAWGDVILARKDVPTSYHLSVAVDDAHQGITHVVRGRDLFDATGLHRLLQHLLGLPQAGLPSPSPDLRRRRAQALQSHRRDRPARAASGRRNSGPYPSDNRIDAIRPSGRLDSPASGAVSAARSPCVYFMSRLRVWLRQGYQNRCQLNITGEIGTG
jgi:hypothetical protein